MKTARRAFVAVGAAFLVFGLVFLGVSFGVRQSMQRRINEGVRAQGEFISVGKGDTWIRYQAEGETYDIYSSTYSSDMRVGDDVAVWYLPGDPGNGWIEHWATWGVFLIVGGVFALIGAGFLAAMLPKILGRRSLIVSGTPVTAQVTDIAQNRWVKINSKNPYVIHAVCIHPYTGREMKVKSEFLMEDPQAHIRNNEVEVLVDPMRDDRYYMLVENIGRETISQQIH